MKVKRGQCRFCPVVIPKFGALIKHEAEHLAKFKSKAEVNENGLMEVAVDFKDVKLFESKVNGLSEVIPNVNLTNKVSTPPVWNGDNPESVKGPSEGPLPPPRSPKSVSTFVNPSEANEIIPKIEPPSEEDHNTIDSTVISDSTASRDFDGLEAKIRERRISEYRIWKELGQFDWRSEFVKIKGPGNVYQCLLCHGQFKKVNPSTFRLHQMGHTGETPYTAFCCSMKFTRYENRNKHEKAHLNRLRIDSFWKLSTNEKRIWNGREIVAKRPEDEEVTERIRNYDWTKDWIRNKVPGSVRTFKCIQCGYVSAAKCNLLLHIFVHTGETPYKCRLCSFSYRVASSRDSHERIHTGDGSREKRIYKKKSDLVPYPAPPLSIDRLRTRIEPQNLDSTQFSMTLEESKLMKVTLKRVESDSGVSTLLKEAQKRLKAMKNEEIEEKCLTPVSIHVKYENPINFFNENEPEIDFQVQREYPIPNNNMPKKVPILRLVRIDQDPCILKSYPRVFGLEIPPEKSLNPRNGEIQFNEEDLLELEEAMNDLTNHHPIIN